MKLVSGLFRSFKKAPFRGVFFIGLLLFSACTNSKPSIELFHVKQIIDGDTLILNNGDKIRFIGINTPELGHGRFKDEPLANQAKRFVEQKIKGRDILIRKGVEATDHHGRLLAHIFTKDGQNIQTQLLERGLAFAVAIGDNVSLLDEYLLAEQSARNAQKGIWADNFYAPIAARKVVKDKLKGYLRITGKVKRVSQSKNNQILHLDGGFRVLIRRDSWKQYFKGKSKRFIGKSIVARGWTFQTHGIVGVKVYHPSMIEIL